LRHLEGKRFLAAPRFDGIDEQGREILSFIPGDVPRDLAFFSDAQLVAAARLLRRFHDATIDFEPMTPGAVVCHGDASPCNHVFREGMPIALIDFDTARIGSRRDDVGYAAWLWLDLGNPSVQANAQGRRLALFFDAYGMAGTDAIEAVRDAQDSLAGRNVARPEIREWALACRDFVTGHATALDAAIVDHLASTRSRSTPPQAMSAAR